MTPSKLVVVRSSYRNAGDHLITEAVVAQLERFDVEFEVLERPAEWDSRAKENFSEALSSAGAVCLAGGPMISEDLFESFMGNVLDEHLGKTFFYAVGRSDGVNRWGKVNFQQPKLIGFSNQTRDALQQVLGNGLAHSVRDSATLEILHPLASNGSRIFNTGCPVMLHSSWPKPGFKPSLSGESVPRVLLTAPAREHKNAIRLAKWLSHDPRFGQIKVFFQAGVSVPPPRSWSFLKRYPQTPILTEGSSFNKALFHAAMSGRKRNLESVKFVDAAGSPELMRRSVDWADLIVGYRVHAHLYGLSQDKKSLLIAEDLRGFCQVADLDLGSSDGRHEGVITSQSSFQHLKHRIDELVQAEDIGFSRRETAHAKRLSHDNFVAGHLKHNLRLLGLA